MKKIVSLALVLVLALAMLVSCGNISESYANKINKAAEKGEHYTYAQVKEDLGDEAVDVTFMGSGVIIAVKNCTSLEDLEKMIEEDKDIKGIVVTIAAGKATAAKYGEINEDTFNDMF